MKILFVALLIIGSFSRPGIAAWPSHSLTVTGDCVFSFSNVSPDNRLVGVQINGNRIHNPTPGFNFYESRYVSNPPNSRVIYLIATTTGALQSSTTVSGALPQPSTDFALGSTIPSAWNFVDGKHEVWIRNTYLPIQPTQFFYDLDTTFAAESDVPFRANTQVIWRESVGAGNLNLLIFDATDHRIVPPPDSEDDEPGDEDVGGGAGLLQSSGSTEVEETVSSPAQVMGGGGVSGAANTAASSAAEISVEGSDGIDEQFRFSLTCGNVKLKSRSKPKSNLGSDSLSRAIDRVEHTLDSSRAIRSDGNYTFWASGLYSHGQSKMFLGNPASASNHYGVIAGSHIRDPLTQQLFGVAIDAGIGNSVTNTNHLQKTDYQSTQLTLYYNKTFNKVWKFNLHGNFMRRSSHNHRPFISNGQQLIAKSNSITHDYSGSFELNYKHDLTAMSHLKPFVGGSFNHMVLFGYREKNVSDHNLSYKKASMNQAGLLCGLKASFSLKINENQTFLVLPKIAYTNFVRMGRLRQNITNIASHRQSIATTGTPGKHLFSASLGVGLSDNESNTATRLTYTGNTQKYNKSHEVILDWSMKF